jgi:hypothetical protein
MALTFFNGAHWQDVRTRTSSIPTTNHDPNGTTRGAKDDASGVDEIKSSLSRQPGRYLLHPLRGSLVRRPGNTSLDESARFAFSGSDRGGECRAKRATRFAGRPLPRPSLLNTVPT